MTLGIRSIVCAVDFSSLSESVIQTGIGMARHLDARLILVHALGAEQDLVLETGTAPSGPERDRASRHRIETRMAGEPVAWEAVVVRKDPIEAVRTASRMADADLILAGSYGFSGVKRLVWGTLVERMARSVDLPLLIVPQMRKPASGSAPLWTPPRRIVVGCDLTKPSRDIVRLAHEMAAAFAGSLTLLHSMESPFNPDLVEPTQAPYEDVQQMLRNRLQAVLEAMTPPSAVPVSAVVTSGHPAEALRRCARNENADLVIVGIRPHSRLGQMLIGSTTETMLRNGTWPVLVVPPDIRHGAAP